MLAQDKQPPQIDEFVNATTLSQALKAIADGNATVVAGGSDLWAQKDAGVRPMGKRLVNINQIGELGGIGLDGDSIRLGALTTMTGVLESDLLQEHTPLLVQTADRFASSQIRNVSTLGGNIVNASPAADMALSLIALDAVAEVSSAKGSRKIAVADLFQGPGKTGLKKDELITAITVQKPPAGFHSAFCKSGTRPALEISLVAMSLAGTLKDGTLSSPAIAFGAVGPTPLRCPKTEALIDGKKLDDALIAQALDLMVTEIAPIDDARASKWYRTHIARTFLEQELNACR